MRKLILLVSAAAMAAAMPALAQGRGGGNGKGGGQQAEARGGGHQGHGRGNGRAERSDRGGGQARRVERREVRAIEQADRRVERQVRGNDRREVRRAEGRDWGHWASGRGNGQRFAGRSVDWRDGRSLPVRLARGGCPPGLAKQNAFCLPPGQLRRAQMMGQRIDRSRFGAVPQEWLYRFRDDSDFYYRYDDAGYVYRLNRGNDLVSAILPLFGTGLTLGEPLPLGYDAYNLPVPYRDFYADSDDHLYRYDDGAIYQVDTETRLIEGVVALLTGNPISVGSALPAGYDAYNLPMDYRDRYADDADSLYRYSNGGIYQVDPTTMLVQSLVEMVL
ncbi:MAG TPA: hypothetical protein VEW25_07940 [Allosphingosinicella sp.]|nr:hypothetical protein [Allosphingosinicella sp.]